MEDDFQRWLIYNCSQTKQEAEAEAEKILIRRQLEDIAKRLNKGRRIDWKNTLNSKYFIEYEEFDDIICDDYIYARKTSGEIYCLNKNFKDVAIQEIGEERLKKYLRGE